MILQTTAILLIVLVLVVAPVSAEYCGTQQLFFNNARVGGLPSFEGLYNYPSGATEVDENVTITSSSGNVVIDPYITPPISTTETVNLSAGLHEYEPYVYVNSASGTTTLNFTLFKYNATGARTYIYSVKTVDIDALVPTLYSTSVVLNNDVTLAPGDRLLVNVSTATTHPSPIIVHWVYQGSVRASLVEYMAFECPDSSVQVYTSTSSTGAEGISIVFGIAGGLIGSIVILRRGKE
jgi:hypothetical protein